MKKGEKAIKEICKYCGREISKQNMSKHVRSHENGNFDKYTSKTNYHLDHDDLFCKFCGKECKNRNSLVQHEIRCKKNSNKINTIIKGFNDKGNIRFAWNKGLTKETDERVLKHSIKISRPLQINHIYQEHNNNEINKWLLFLKTKTSDKNFKFPEYIATNGDRPVIKQCSEPIYLLDKWNFESDYLMNYIFNGLLTAKNTVHHIDNNSSNNDITNLMVFKDKGNHNRFHHSNYAFLVYNEVTHIFECIIKK